MRCLKDCRLWLNESSQSHPILIFTDLLNLVSTIATPDIPTRLGHKVEAFVSNVSDATGPIPPSPETTGCLATVISRRLLTLTGRMRTTPNTSVLSTISHCRLLAAVRTTRATASVSRHGRSWPTSAVSRCG